RYTLRCDVLLGSLPHGAFLRVAAFQAAGCCPPEECAISLFPTTRDTTKARRAIDIHEGEEVDESAFKALVRQAVALNSSGKSKPSKKGKP
ncbi:MAG TPA: hypothetical protein VGK32_02475, partial [Vicinamibacterales bacterium]